MEELKLPLPVPDVIISNVMGVLNAAFPVVSVAVAVTVAVP